jgi:hypothetical protein
LERLSVASWMGTTKSFLGAFEIIFHLFAAKCGRCVNAVFFRVVGMVVLLKRGIRSKWYSLEWTRRIVAEKSSNMTQLVLFALRRSREAIGGAKAALKAAYKGTFALRLSKFGQLCVANTINVVHTQDLMHKSSVFHTKFREHRRIKCWIQNWEVFVRQWHTCLRDEHQVKRLRTHLQMLEAVLRVFSHDIR